MHMYFHVSSLSMYVGVLHGYFHGHVGITDAPTPFIFGLLVITTTAEMQVLGNQFCACTASNKHVLCDE